MLAVGLLIHLAVLRRSEAQERNRLTASFAGHVLAALLQVWLVLYYFPGGGDMLGYYAEGVMGAESLRSDFWRFAPELWAALWRQEYHLPFEFSGTGATLSTSAAASFIVFVAGDSLYSSCMVVAIAAYLSQYSLYLALRMYFRPEQRPLILVGTCLIPSGVYWSSGLFKEALVMSALGPVVLALHWLANGQRRSLAIALGVGAGTVLVLIKPYVVMALSISASVFYLRRRFQAADPELKPFAIITSLLLAMGGLTIGSQYLGKDSTEGSAAMVAQQRRVGYANQGGSDYYLDSPAESGDTKERTLAQELALAPLGLATALFRPLIFEARNAVQLANSIEATLLLVLFIQIIMRLGWAGFVRETMRSPVLAFCAVFAFALGLGTGLASSNLGTLSRYRAPMMPFFFTLLLMLRFGTKSRLEVETARLRGAEAQSP